MKSKHLCKHSSLLLAILMLLPLFAFGTTAEEAEISAAQSAVKAEADALAAKKADLVQGLEAESTIFDYVDKASFVAAGHVERLPEEEELNSYVFRNPDGSKTVYFLAEDVKYVSVTGAVTEKKLDLVALDGGYTTHSSNVSLALPNDLHRGITLAHGGATVSLVPNRSGLAESASVATSSLFAALEEMEQELVSAPTGISAGRADYQNAFGVGTTLRYTPTLSGVKEDVILDRYRGKNSFSFTLSTGNLSVFNENGRYFIAESAEAEEKIFIGETWVYDSQDHFEKGTLSVTQKADGLYTLTIGASTAFLTSPDTVYPVYIDPSLTVSYGETGNGYMEDVTVFEGIPNINCGGFFYNTVGASSDYGKGRTAIRLTGLFMSDLYRSLVDQNLTSVEFCVTEASGTNEVSVSLYPLQSISWTESGATWNNIGSHYETAVATAKLKNSDLATFDITNLVRQWKSMNAGTYNPEQGFIMIAENETTPNKQFYSSEYPYDNMQTATVSLKPYVVMEYEPIISINGNSSTWYVEPGGTLQMTAATVPAGLPVTWEVSDINVAMINSQLGLLSGISCGNVTVFATGHNPDGTTFSTSATVRVIPLLPGEYYFLNKEYLRGLYLEDDELTSGEGVVLEEPSCNIGDEISSLLKYRCQSSTWIFTYNPTGFYTIRYKRSAGKTNLNLCYDEDQILTLSSYTNVYTRWVIEKTSSGSFKLIPYVEKLTENCISVTKTEYSSGPYNAIGFNVSLGAYTGNDELNDEWEINSAEVTLLNYYDSSIANTAILRDIETASQFVSDLFEQHYDVHINVVSPTQLDDYVADQCSKGIDEPCDDTCGTCSNQSGGYSENTETNCYHHKNTKRIAMQLSELCQSNEMIVMWSNRAPGTFCTTDGNTEVLRSEYGITYGNLPVIQILLNKEDFVNTDGSDDSHARVALMVSCLLHEIGHYYGLEELYNQASHGSRDNTTTCTMKKLDQMYYDNATLGSKENTEMFYENLLNGSIAPFCDECEQELHEIGRFYYTMYKKRR